MFRDPGNLPWNNNGMASGEAAEAAPPLAIGQIQKASGSVTVTRVTGVVVAVKPGDLVYQGDVVETAADGAVGIIFADGTAFSLSEGARMALDEFACDRKGLRTQPCFNSLAGRSRSSLASWRRSVTFGSIPRSQAFKGARKGAGLAF